MGEERILIDDPGLLSRAKKGPLCQRKCEGERSNTESPAKVVSVWSDGQRKSVVVCQCCREALIHDPIGGTPALDPRVNATTKRFTCRQCQYNVVLLSDLKEE